MRAFHTTVYIIYCNRDKLKVISYIWPLSQHIIQEVSCATYRCGHQIYSHKCTGILSKSPNDDKKCRKEKNCWKKTRHCYYQTTEPNACLWVYNCRRKKWNEDKKPYYDAKKQPIQNLWNEKKLVKSLFNVCHCSCCWCCDNNIGHCKLLSCKNLQWTMVEKSKKISSQLMHDENIFFPCSFAVFILPIWINFGIFKELFLQIIGAQRTIFNRYFILLVSYILLINLFLSLVTYFEVKWYLKVIFETIYVFR